MNIAQAATKDIAITIAAAQSTSVPLDVAANVQEHLRFVEAAADHGVQWLVFPELSLTGYELAAMPSLMLHADHALLAPLRDASRRTGMAITVGAPVDSDTALPSIGAITLWPDGQHSVYRKFHLHGGGHCQPHEAKYRPVKEPSTHVDTRATPAVWPCLADVPPKCAVHKRD